MLFIWNSYFWWTFLKTYKNIPPSHLTKHLGIFLDSQSHCFCWELCHMRKKHWKREFLWERKPIASSSLLHLMHLQMEQLWRQLLCIWANQVIGCLHRNDLFEELLPWTHDTETALVKVNNDLLMTSLVDLDTNPSFYCRWLNVFLSQYVPHTSVTHGVPQGSVVGLRLFHYTVWRKSI